MSRASLICNECSERSSQDAYKGLSMALELPKGVTERDVK